MKATCKYNKSSDLPETNTYFADLPTARYALSIDKEYDIFAITLWEGNLYILTYADDSIYSWYPYDLFTFSVISMSENWFFGVIPDDNGGQRILWGYKEMLYNKGHYADLIENNPHAIAIIEKERLSRNKNLI